MSVGVQEHDAKDLPCSKERHAFIYAILVPANGLSAAMQPEITSLPEVQ